MVFQQPAVCDARQQMHVDQRPAGPVCDADAASGYVGIAGRGLIDFEVNEFVVDPKQNSRLVAGEVDCYACYPLGDSLQLIDGTWQVRFVGLFATDGRQAEVRIADSETPAGGWEAV